MRCELLFHTKLVLTCCYRISIFDFAFANLDGICAGWLAGDIARLVFGFDVAFIAFHHTARVMLVFFSLPIMISVRLICAIPYSARNSAFCKFLQCASARLIYE